jgi:tape measure domain-containing protein
MDGSTTETIVVKIKPEGHETTANAIRKVTVAADGLTKKTHTVKIAADGTKTVTESIHKIHKAAEKMAAAAEKAAARTTAAANRMAGAGKHLGFEGLTMGGRGAPFPLGRGGGTMGMAADFTTKARGKPAFTPDASGDRMAGFAAAMTGANLKQGTTNVNKMSSAIRKAGRQAKISAGHFSLFGRVVAVIGVIQLARGIIRTTDTFTNLQNKVATVTDSVAKTSVVLKHLTTVANDSRSALSSVATVFARTERAMVGYGRSTRETIQFTDTLSKAIQVGGSTAIEASNAAIQLSQGLASGTLRGDELRSVLEQLPIVAQLIADKLNTTVGALRAMGEQGKISTEVVFDAMLEGTQGIEEKFSKLRLTFAQAWERMKTAAVVASERMQDSVSSLADVLVMAADNIDTLIDAAKSLGGVLLVGLFAKGIHSATVGVRAFTAVCMANPIIAGGVLIAAATAALLPFISNMEIASDATATWSDLTDALWTTMLQGAEDSKDPLDEIGEKIEGLSDKTESWLLKLAKVADFGRRVGGHLGEILEGSIAQDQAGLLSGDRGGKELNPTYFQDLVKGTSNLVNERAQEREDRRLLREADEMIAESELDDKGKRTIDPFSKTKKGRKPSGKTLEQVMDELQRQRILSRVGGGLEGQVESGFLSARSSLLKTVQDKMTAEQDASLKLAIRQNEEYEEALKLVQQITDQLAEKRKQEQQISIGIGQGEQEGRRSNDMKVFMSDESVKNALDPMREYNAELVKYQDFLSRYPEQLDAVERKLAEQSQAHQMIMGVFDGLGQSMADAAANAIVFGDNLSDALTNISKQLASTAISTALQLLVTGGANSIGLGMSPVPLMPARIGSGASGGYFQSGGYTGSGGRGDIAGVVHGKEFVVNANATARNRAMLESMNAGKQVNGTPSINVHNYGGQQVDVQHNPSTGDIEVMINKALQERGPAIVAGEMGNANGNMSKAIRRNFGIKRAR